MLLQRLRLNGLLPLLSMCMILACAGTGCDSEGSSPGRGARPFTDPDKALDPNQLAMNARQARDPEARLAAVKALTDEVQLIALASEEGPLDDHVRAIAILALSKQKMPPKSQSTTIPTTTEEPTTTLENGNLVHAELITGALQRVSDHDALMTIIHSAAPIVVRIAAVNRLQDQAQLKALALGLEVALAEAAATKLTDPTTAREVVDGSRSSRVSVAALRAIADQQLLADIACHHLSKPVRLAAVQLVVDEELLWKVFGESLDVSIRVAALQRMSDEKKLAEIAYRNPDREVRLAAARSLPDDPKALIILAMDSENAEQARAALASLLAKHSDHAKSTPDWWPSPAVPDSDLEIPEDSGGKNEYTYPSAEIALHMGMPYTVIKGTAGFDLSMVDGKPETEYFWVTSRAKGGIV